MLLEASLVIPAHNEEHRLFDTLTQYRREMREKFEEKFEIIVVANGCSDRTVAVANRLAASSLQIRVVEVERAIGKGGAVLEGFRRAQGEKVAFADADGATAAASLIELFQKLNNSDIVIGSRRVEGSIITQSQTAFRRLASFVFAKTSRVLFGMPYHDTQCGAKALRSKAARQLCHIVHQKGWTFDLDLLLCAHRLGLKISEHPVGWTNKEGSRLRYASTTWEVLRALWSMKRQQRWPLEMVLQPSILSEAGEKAVAGQELV